MLNKTPPFFSGLWERCCPRGSKTVFGQFWRLSDGIFSSVLYATLPLASGRPPCVGSGEHEHWRLPVPDWLIRLGARLARLTEVTGLIGSDHANLCNFPRVFWTWSSSRRCRQSILPLSSSQFLASSLQFSSSLVPRSQSRDGNEWICQCQYNLCLSLSGSKCGN